MSESAGGRQDPKRTDRLSDHAEAETRAQAEARAKGTYEGRQGCAEKRRPAEKGFQRG